jgi:hypothetical protein
MSQKTFQPGDVVQLKSGGPKMTVTVIDSDKTKSKGALLGALKVIVLYNGLPDCIPAGGSGSLRPAEIEPCKYKTCKALLFYVLNWLDIVLAHFFAIELTRLISCMNSSR